MDDTVIRAQNYPTDIPRKRYMVEITGDYEHPKYSIYLTSDSISNRLLFVEDHTSMRNAVNAVMRYQGMMSTDERLVRTEEFLNQLRDGSSSVHEVVLGLFTLYGMAKDERLFQNLLSVYDGYLKGNYRVPFIAMDMYNYYAKYNPYLGTYRDLHALLTLCDSEDMARQVYSLLTK